MWRTVLPILLLGLVLVASGEEIYKGPPYPCGSTEHCRRETCNDTRATVPPKCRRNSKILQCNEVCRDPLELLNCFKERSKNNTEEYCVLKYRRELENHDSRNTTHPGIPCSLKCLVDPEFWTCVHSCDGKGCLKSFRQCEEVWTNGTIPPACSNLTLLPGEKRHMINGTCFTCYVETLRDELSLSPECVVRYPQPQSQQTVIKTIQTSCVEIIEGAAGVIAGDNVTRNITEKCFINNNEPFEQCFLKLLMERQITWCMQSSGLYTPACKGKQTAKGCHDKCLRLLTKPFCYIPCPRNPTLEICVKHCNTKWPPIDCFNNGTTGACDSTVLDASSRLTAYDEMVKACPTQNHGCYQNSIVSGRHLENCQSKRFVKDFARRLIALRSVSGNFGPDIEDLVEHYFYADCLHRDCKLRSREDGIRCVQTCMKKVRSDSEIGIVCDETMEEGRVMRSAILLWCMLKVDSSRFWTFESLLTFKDVEDFILYDALSRCEVVLRNKNDNSIGAAGFREFAKIIYEMEQKSCEDCEEVVKSKLEYHPYRLDQARCELNQCYKSTVSHPNLCPPPIAENEIKLVLDAQCQWKVDLSLSREPFKIWSTYFDEISPIDQTNNLRSPNGLKYLQKSALLSRTGHYVFPYFLVIRGTCEEGFYDEAVYKFIDNGGSPVVVINYSTQISRLVFTTFMSARFQSALINLQRQDEADIEYIPQNPLNRINKTTNKYDGKSGCHLNLCYPAFVVPQPLLQIPMFEYSVGTQQTFYRQGGFQFASGLHVRDVSGLGRLKVADYDNPPRADEFFPRRKVLNYEDTQLTFMSFCFPDRRDANARSGHNDCPELEHITDHNCYPLDTNETVGGNPFAPLDTEDFMRLQFSYKITTLIVIAGFYDPNLVIIGDANLEKFETVRWKFDATDGSEGVPEEQSPRLFHGRYPCFSANFKVHGFHKPMYSQFDRTDPGYGIQFYRTRYAPKNYTNATLAKAIFGALTLQDRVLLVTTSGLVTLYVNDNITASGGRAWAVDPRDRVQKCFKIVRTAQRAQPNSDTVVAISYDYQEFYPETNVLKDISQEVYIGTSFQAGQPLEWRKIGEKSDLGANLKEERVFNMDDELGVTEPLPDAKSIGIPVERRETTPKSQIEAICYKAYRSNMGKSADLELFEDHGWCDAIDAVPISYPEREIQVLVRMKVYYSGGYGVTGGTSSASAPRRIAFFYVIANLKTDTPPSQPPVWKISSIIPRIPCLDEHTEGVPNVVQFNADYFRKGDPAVVGTNYGCHTIPANQELHNQIFLHGITYTRTYNSHMFLFGNKLLQSNDGGNTFVYLRSFPEKSERYKCERSALRYHRIKLMAFDDSGHYAFLTSKRELWYGNVGSLNQVRLRPSDTFSMITARQAQVREMSEAVPFSVFFDSDDNLVEMVAVVDKNGDVERISRRSINEKTIRRAKWYIKQLGKYADNLLSKLALIATDPNAKSKDMPAEMLEPLRYQPSKYTIFCPYSSPAFRHNFSVKHARAQTFVFPVPGQHADLGNTYLKSTLLTYQAIIFGLVWNTYLHEPHRTYSYVNLDPFIQWNRNRKEDAVIGALQYVHNNATTDGILVEPVKYTRVFNNEADSRRLFKIFYMDYGMVLSFTIEYSISNDFDLSSIDYENHKLSLIHINVENANGSLIQVNTEKEVIASRAAVRYTMHISVKQQDDLPQRTSGRDGIPVPLLLHLIGGFGNCIKTLTSATGSDTVGTIINVGCPPSIDIVFDWNSTLYSIKFRDPTAHYGATKKECYNGEQFCFFARYPLIPHFHLFDNSKQQHFNFSGKYIMRIVAGGYSRHDMKVYTTEEREAFNVPGVSDVSLIWTEWDRSHHQKIDRKGYGSEVNRKDNREIVLRAGVSAIHWACHTLSPCARIAPRSTLETVYYFEVLITNEGVDNDTLCLFEKKFIILLYGFPPSPEVQLMTTVFFYVMMIAVLYILYFCLRGHKKLWRSTNMKLYGWFQIVKDTLPKSWTKSDENEETELDEQRRRDEIILSLQGHLKVPAFVKRPTTQDQHTRDNSPNVSHHSSMSSHYSLTSGGGSQPALINPIAQRPGAMTWTDLIYEQIISRRLAAIIEKNRMKAEQLRKKASGMGTA